MTEKLQLRWPVDKRLVNQRFGENPNSYRPFGLAGHEGLDLFAPMHANVYAAAHGEVYRVDHPPDHPYGLHIRIKHEVGGKVYRTVYAHLAQASVSVGQRVVADERIGLADNTGNSTGSHLHLTLKIDGAQTPGYPPGIVDPWPFLRATTEELPPASDLIVYPIAQLSLRAAPSISSNRVAILNEGEPLTVLENADAARARVSKQGEWIQVQTETGLGGFVAAWFLRLTGQTAPVSSLVVFPTHLLSVRARPATGAIRLITVTPDDTLQVLGDANSSRAKIGQQEQWLNVRASSGHTGYVAAWFVRAEAPGLAAAPPASPFLTLTVFPTADVNLRAQPSINSPQVGRALFNRRLAVLDDDPVGARAKVGQEEQWLFVETEDKERGWAAAWFLSLTQA